MLNVMWGSMVGTSTRFKMYKLPSGQIVKGHSKIISSQCPARITSNFIACGIAVPAFARAFMVNIIQEYRGRLIYSDTDSLHLTGTEIPEKIHISELMGDFKLEAIFTEARYICIKNYIYRDTYKKYNIVASTIKKSEHAKIIENLENGGVSLKNG